MLLPTKKSISCCFSHQNPPTFLFCPVSTCKQLDLWIFLSWYRWNNFFTEEKTILWTHILAEHPPPPLKKKQTMVKIIFMKTFSFLLHKTLIGLEWCALLVDYCDVFYQLFGLSFWRHPFTAIIRFFFFEWTIPLRKNKQFVGCWFTSVFPV